MMAYYFISLLIAFLFLTNTNGVLYGRTFTNQLLTIANQKTVENERLPQDFLDTASLILQAGFDCQKAKVITEDGYILQLHRIINPRRKINGPPILLMHGVFAASDSWVNGKSSLGFLLSNEGFDVWLGDERGNHYSKSHVKYKSSMPKFWDFSFQESGFYDIPAFIDFILKTTGYKKLTYIGHSMGTTVLLAGLSLRPEYNSKLEAVLLLAPIGTVPSISELTSPILRMLLLQSDGIKAGLNTGRVYELLPRTKSIIKFMKTSCGLTTDMRQDFCLDFIGSCYGEHRTNLNRTVLGEQIKYLPAGSSVKTMHHLTQLYKTGFRMYNYGKDQNLKRYGTKEPPFYLLNSITAPIGIYWGDNDNLMNENSANQLADKFPNLLFNEKISDPKFTHVDFLFGLNANQILYSKIVHFLRNYHDILLSTQDFSHI